MQQDFQIAKKGKRGGLRERGLRTCCDRKAVPLDTSFARSTPTFHLHPQLMPLSIWSSPFLTQMVSAIWRCLPQREHAHAHAVGRIIRSNEQRSPIEGAPHQ